MTTADLAGRLDVSYEAVRQQIKQLEALGLVERSKRPNPSGTGRPLRYYCLSAPGDHLFPKNYDELAVSLIDAIGGALGNRALYQVLGTLADAQVAQWQSRMEGKNLRERLEMLQAIYIENDPFTEVSTEDAKLQLVERNCPYLNVATRRPALCSLTVSVLTRLLGHRVTRVQRFQNGDGRCVFRVHVDQPIESETFKFEPEPQ
ncbi:MAG TPA: DNA-binding protein, partial [Candidatus Binatia bacterium]|nr:DNA-binding protein [Candidatus Binatia bacterium]